MLPIASRILYALGNFNRTTPKSEIKSFFSRNTFISVFFKVIFIKEYLPTSNEYVNIVNLIILKNKKKKYNTKYLQRDVVQCT